MRGAERAAAEAAKAAAEATARAKAKQAARAKAKTKKGSGKSSDRDSDPKSCSVPPRHSFIAGTKVLLADGTSKRIEQLQPGDTVQATDPATGKSAPRQVTHTIRTDDDKEFVDLTIRDTDGGKHRVTAIDHHPFWSATQGRWVDAGDLKPDELFRTSAGTYVQITAVRHYQAHRITYDLTVDTDHTYFVLVGGTPVLVHNNGCGGKKPHEIGKRGVDELEKKLVAQGFNIIGREVLARIPGFRHAKGNYRKYDLVAERDGYLFLYESKNGPGAVYGLSQQWLDKVFSEVGLILYGRHARRAGIAGYHDPSRFVIRIVYQDV